MWEDRLVNTCLAFQQRQAPSPTKARRSCALLSTKSTHGTVSSFVAVTRRPPIQKIPVHLKWEINMSRTIIYTKSTLHGVTTRSGLIVINFMLAFTLPGQCKRPFVSVGIRPSLSSVHASITLQIFTQLDS